MNAQTLTERQNERSSESRQAGLNGRVVTLEDRVKGIGGVCLPDGTGGFRAVGVCHALGTQ